jgi:hypothetical protein
MHNPVVNRMHRLGSLRAVRSGGGLASRLGKTRG